MPGREHAAGLVRDLGEAIGLEGLQLDDDGYCCLSFDDDLVINLEHDEVADRLLFYAWLGPADGDRLQLYEQLLDANFFWKGTNGATLALEKERGGVVLLEQVPLGDLDGPGFQARLGNFVTMTEGWRAQVRAAAGTSEPAGPSVERPGGPGIWA